MIKINKQPSSRELKWFGGLLLLFVGALGALVCWRGESLLRVAAILGTAWLISLIFNGDNRKAQLLGVLLPGLCLAIGVPIKAGAQPTAVAYILWTVGGICGLAVLASPSIGRWIFLVWMRAALPIGWSISHGILAVTYYSVLTPTGLIMRRCGRDPMHRRFQHDVPTYWISRSPSTDTSRYFRQF